MFNRFLPQDWVKRVKMIEGQRALFDATWHCIFDVGSYQLCWLMLWIFHWFRLSGMVSKASSDNPREHLQEIHEHLMLSDVVYQDVKGVVLKIADEPTEWSDWTTCIFLQRPSVTAICDVSAARVISRTFVCLLVFFEHGLTVWPYWATKHGGCGQCFWMQDQLSFFIILVL